MPEGVGRIMELTPAEARHVTETNKEKGGLVARWARVHGNERDQARLGLYREIGYDQMPENLRRRVGNSELLVTTRENADKRAKEKEEVNKARMERYMKSPVQIMDHAATQTRHMRPIGHIDDVDFSKRQRYGGKGQRVEVPHREEE